MTTADDDLVGGRTSAGADVTTSRQLRATHVCDECRIMLELAAIGRAWTCGYCGLIVPSAA